ncbi:hypothetical protein ABH935_009385 [Catenulispora sp. GAS73]|uniref:hypothetical protein n=1 Tax=Catenulispora sp. GAS73 TaxID=3156269 RepID=UPI0035142E28
MRNRVIPFLALAVAGLMVAGATEAEAAGSIFQVVSTPNTETAPISNDLLTGASSTSTHDVWAVGFATDPGTTDHTLAEHWNGTKWSVSPTPDGTSGSQLAAVAAVSPTNAWAVGFQNSALPIASNTTLIEHWNGSAWSIVPSPNPDTEGDVLTSVTATSADDVWAAGYFTTGGGNQILPLFEHWNGTAWSVVQVPAVDSSVNFVRSINALSPTNVWAVGYQIDDSSGHSDDLILHWDGTRWTDQPILPIGQVTLQSVHAVSANDVWAVGTALGDTGGDSNNLALHWNGSAWTSVKIPNVDTPSQGSNFMESVTALSSNDVWAVGAATGSAGVNQTMIEHWNGSAWSIVPGANEDPQGDNSNTLFSVVATGAGSLTAVGPGAVCSRGTPGRARSPSRRRTAELRGKHSIATCENGAAGLCVGAGGGCGLFVG